MQKHGCPDRAKQKPNTPDPHVDTPCSQHLIIPEPGLMSLLSISSLSESLDDDVSSWNHILLTCWDYDGSGNL